jgi:hypothetical protein
MVKGFSSQFSESPGAALAACATFVVERMMAACERWHASRKACRVLGETWHSAVSRMMTAGGWCVSRSSAVAGDVAGEAV